jgi:hypothetical protein
LFDNLTRLNESDIRHQDANQDLIDLGEPCLEEQQEEQPEDQSEEQEEEQQNERT